MRFFNTQQWMGLMFGMEATIRHEIRHIISQAITFFGTSTAAFVRSRLSTLS